MGKLGFPATNEAELQASLLGRIRAALPLLPAEVRLERYLRLSLGHFRFSIDGLRGWQKKGVYGRYDILVLNNEMPLLLVELKAPDIAVTQEDVQQVLSYAKCHDPQVPLVMLTNGNDTRLVRTYDQIDLDPSDVAAGRLASILGATAAIASSGTENAIRTLLGSSGDIWEKTFSVWNDSVLKALTGEITDFGSPLIRNLTIPRLAGKQIDDVLSSGPKVLVVHGLPLSGVTNVLAQYVKAHQGTSPTLYIDGNSTADAFQLIANWLSQQLSFMVTKDHFRAWLNTCGDLVQITLVVDGIPREGLDELLDGASRGLVRLVLGMNSNAYRKAVVHAGGIQKTQLGRLATSIEIPPLSDEEYSCALEAFRKDHFACLVNGSQYSNELRMPHRLRVLMARLPHIPPATGSEGTALRVLLPLADPCALEDCGNTFASDPELRYRLQQLAKEFLRELETHASDQVWLSLTYGRPTVDPERLRAVIGESGVSELQRIGFVSWVEFDSLGPRLRVRVEELLANHVAEEWKMRLSALHDSAAISQAIDGLLKMSAVIREGEVALSAAIHRATQANPLVLQVAVNHLLASKPTIEKVEKGTVAAILTEDGPIPLRFSGAVNEGLVGNLQPWIVLSHLASLPLEAEGEKRTFNFHLFRTLGASPHLLQMPGPSPFNKMHGIHFHEIPGMGSIPCMSVGLVEPLLQALVTHSHRHPEELEALAQGALADQCAFLIWRVMTVAYTLKESADEADRIMANGVLSTLTPWLDNVLGQACQHTNTDSSSHPVTLPEPD